MTLVEALVQGVQTTILGMATVFAVLIILMVAIGVMKNIFYKPAVKTEVAPEPVVAPQTAIEEKKDEDENEEELIAVLTAAVAASLNTSTYNLKIKSYRRTDKRNPAWNTAGIKDVINSRF